MFYHLYTGDYVNYVKASDQYFDYLSQQQTADLGYDAYALSRLSNKAFGEESSDQWEMAAKSWQSADSAWQTANRKNQETYPNMPVYYYSLSSLYEAKLGRLRDYQAPLAELDDYYTAYQQVAPLQPAMRIARAQQYGFYRDTRYRTEYQSIVKNMSQTRDFTEATRPMAHYAYFLMRDQLEEESFRVYQDLFKANLEWINDIIFTFGEKAFVAYYATKLKEGYDNFHSFVKQSHDRQQALSGKALAQAYDNTLLTKSIAFKGVRKRKQAFKLSNSDGINALYEAWIAKKQDLIRCYQVLQAQEQKNGNNQELATLINEDSLTLLQQEVAQMENRLATESKDFRTTLKIGAPDWKKVRKQLKPGEAAVEMVRFRWRGAVYYSDTTYYAAYIIKPDSKSPEVVYFPELADNLENRYYNYYKNAIRLKFEDEVSYQQYWKPIADQLEGIDKVYFSPDGIFHMISLPTLQNPETGQFLLDEVRIQHVTSTGNIGQTENLSFSTSQLFGRPAYELNQSTPTTDTTQNRSFVRNFRNADVTDLPGTEQEVKAIEQTMRAHQVASRSYLGPEAVEHAFYTLRSPDILHIATHGFWSEPNDQKQSSYQLFNALVNSGLLLSGVVNYYRASEPAFTHDGILTAYEAQNLDLEQTKLVVLSACETGLGSINAGEGVYGLQRAFRAAGARYLVTSLWKVDDAGTRDFMVAFYNNLLDTKEVSQSFRMAQKAMKDKYQDPYFWGAFVLTGG